MVFRWLINEYDVGRPQICRRAPKEETVGCLTLLAPSQMLGGKTIHHRVPARKKRNLPGAVQTSTCGTCCVLLYTR